MRSKWEGVRNQAKFGMFLAPKFFGGQDPKFLDQCYKIEHAYEHHANFCSDQPRDLGDYAVKKIIKTVVKHEAFWTIVSGGLINTLRYTLKSFVEPV